MDARQSQLSCSDEDNLLCWLASCTQRDFIRPSSQPWAGSDGTPDIDGLYLRHQQGELLVD